MCEREDGGVRKLPNTSISQFFAGTKPQVWNLSDHLYKVLGVLRREPLELAGTSLQGGRMCHYQDVISFAFTFTDDFFCYLVASTYVCIIRFGNH